MKTPSLSEIQWNKRIDIRTQELKGIDCEEFGQTGEGLGKVKIGYNPLDSRCAACKAGILCMEIADKTSLQDNISVVKEQLGVKWFYDENRIKELGHKVMDDMHTAIVERSGTDAQLSLTTFEAVCRNVIDQQLRSQDPMMYDIIVEVLTNRGVIFDKLNNTVYVNEKT